MRALYSKLRLWSNKTVSQLKNAERIAASDSNSLESSVHRSWLMKDLGLNIVLENKNIGVVPPSSCKSYSISSQLLSSRGLSLVSNHSAASAFMLAIRNFSTAGSTSPDVSVSVDVPQRIKFKRLDKTARHIMQIIDKEEVEEVKANREFPEIKPGYIVQLKVEVPENKRRVSTIKGIVIARRNAGLHSTFRIRRLVAGVGIESLFHLYSPNIKEITVLDKKKVRRAKLYYLRDKMNPLRTK